MPIARLLIIALLVPSVLNAVDQADREALRYNDAITKLMQARDEAQANAKARAVTALTVIAKNRTKAEDAAGAGEAWKAILGIDREHADARAYFTQLGTLAAVLKELDADPTDLLGQDSQEKPK